MSVKNTIADYLNEHSESDNGIYELDTGLSKSYAQVVETANIINNTLVIGEGSILTVVLPNSILYVEYFVASMLGGWIFNPIPYFTQVQELDKILSYVNPDFIITDRNDIIKSCKDTHKLISSHDYLKSDYKKIVSNIRSDMPAALYYSSGTTGNPKGVIYTHENMVSLIGSIVRGFKFSKKDRQLALLPFGHTASINYNILPSLMVGCDLYISQGFEKLRSNFFKVLSDYKITYTQIVPTILFVLNKLKVDISKIDLLDISFIGCGSSTLPIKAQDEFFDKYNIPISNLYGLSETGPSHIDDPRELGWSSGSIGQPLDVNECKISIDGEILLKGKNIFHSYHKNKKLYDKVVEDEWFHTGDLGFIKEGKFYFSDRKKDLIILGGINIVPMEIEEVLYNHLNVLECAVVGKKNDLHGEEIVAVIVPRDSSYDQKKFSQELKKICKEKLSSYKIPRIIYFWESIPKTHSKKIMRRKVRDEVNNY